MTGDPHERYVIGTQPAELLDAMLAMVRRAGVDAQEVTGYRERSYNIGHCHTCSSMAEDVRIYYRRPDGSPGHYQVEFTDLGELIRELTDDPTQRNAWESEALRESEDEREERFSVHGFDEEPRQ